MNFRLEVLLCLLFFHVVPVHTSPALTQCHEGPCGVTHSETGGVRVRFSLNKEKTQGLVFMLFGTGDRGENVRGVDIQM